MTKIADKGLSTATRDEKQIKIVDKGLSIATGGKKQTEIVDKRLPLAIKDNGGLLVDVPRVLPADVPSVLLVDVTEDEKI